MFRYLLFFSLIILIDSKIIFPWNITTNTTTTTKKTSVFSTSTTKTSTVSTTFNPPMTTTIELEEELLTTTATVNNKPYEFQSNFSRNNDSVFVSLHSNISDTFMFINNTFISDKYPCEILFNEHSNSMIQTKIVINFNGLFIRDLATQLGDRLIDIVDLLSEVRIMANQNKTRETV